MQLIVYIFGGNKKKSNYASFFCCFTTNMVNLIETIEEEQNIKKIHNLTV